MTQQALNINAEFKVPELDQVKALIVVAMNGDVDAENTLRKVSRIVNYQTIEQQKTIMTAAFAVSTIDHYRLDMARLAA